MLDKLEMSMALVLNKCVLLEGPTVIANRVSAWVFPGMARWDGLVAV